MPLRIKVACSGEEHEILIKATDEFDDDFEVELVNHDREYDIAFKAMGGDLPRCYVFERNLERGIDGIFGDDVLRKVFLKALGEQGVGVLGMDEGTLADEIVEVVGRPLRRGLELSDVLSEIHELLPWFEQRIEFRHAVHEWARLAYENGHVGVFDVLWEMGGGGLLAVKEIDEEGDWGEGHAINRATIKIMIDDSVVDEWTFGCVGWFSDIERLVWYIEREDGSGSANGTTDEFLRVSGIEGSDAIESNYRPDPPELPERHKAGKWAIIQESRLGDDYFCGYFKSEEDARAMYQIALDIARTTQTRGSTKLIHRTAKSKAKDFDTWEVLEEDEYVT